MDILSISINLEPCCCKRPPLPIKKKLLILNGPKKPLTPVFGPMTTYSGVSFLKRRKFFWSSIIWYGYVRVVAHISCVLCFSAEWWLAMQTTLLIDIDQRVVLSWNNAFYIVYGARAKKSSLYLERWSFFQYLCRQVVSYAWILEHTRRLQLQKAGAKSGQSADE